MIGQTGEIFLDYESYANRYLFYSQPLFSPNLPLPDPQLMSFFQALNLEHQHLDRLIQSKFPSRLKSRLLSSILEPTAQLTPNIDGLVDHLHRLYHNRFDIGEKVMVDLSFNQLPSTSSSIYYAKVVRVFPPKSIRDLDKNAYGDLIHLQAIDRFHLDLTNCLEIDDPKAYLYTIQLIDDDQSNSDNFGASYMEVETRKLSRHSDTFSKSLLKRFLQSVLLPFSPHKRYPRWAIHPNISPQDSNPRILPLPPIPVPSHKALIKHVSIGSTKPDQVEPDSKKRKKNKLPCHPLKTSIPKPHPSYQDCTSNSTDPTQSPISPQSIKFLNQKDQLKYHLEKLQPSLKNSTSLINCPLRKKKKKAADLLSSTTPTPTLSQTDLILPSNIEVINPPDPSENHGAPGTTNVPKELKKSIKYPIEDLDLDPLTIIDGRYLRRVNCTPLKLPKKPQLTRPEFSRKFSQRLKIWSFANIFKLNKRRCRFEEFDDSLDDLTARLVKLILSHSRLAYPTSRAKKFTSISVLPFFATHPSQECRVMSIDEREYWVRKGLRFVNISRRFQEFSRATSSHKKKPSKAVVDEDWVMGLMEIMCHRGGIERLGCLARILKYLLSIDATLLTIDHAHDQEEQVTEAVVIDSQNHQPKSTQQDQQNAQAPSNLEGESPLTSNLDESAIDDHSDLEGADEVEDEEPENGVETGDEDGRRYGRSIRHQRPNPRLLKKTLKSRFEGLPVDDKLTLIDFLCDLAAESDQVRNYMEECDEKLTLVRKEKADVNKEKRKILEELSRLDGRKVDPTTKPLPDSSGEPNTTNKDRGLSPIVGHLPPLLKQESSTNGLHASPVEIPDPSGVTERNSIEHSEGLKLKTNLSKPASLSVDSNINFAQSTSLSFSKSSSPHSKPGKKLESPVKASLPNPRPLVTPVRIATLNARQIKQPSTLISVDGDIDREKQHLERQLFEIGLRELQLQERFRQLIGVTKLKPLGIDRFYCKYWWFEGIGGMEIHQDEGLKPANHQDHPERHHDDEMKWYSGSIFVSGPSFEEWEKICESYGGPKAVLKRRLREELGFGGHPDHQVTDDNYLDLKHQLIGVDEWGIYEAQDQIEELINWLNSKGTRENHLKFNLKEWKEYIMTGIQNRAKFLPRKREDEPSNSTQSVLSSSNPLGHPNPRIEVEDQGQEKHRSRDAEHHDQNLNNKSDGSLLGMNRLNRSNQDQLAKKPQNQVNDGHEEEEEEEVDDLDQSSDELEMNDSRHLEDGANDEEEEEEDSFEGDPIDEHDD